MGGFVRPDGMRRAWLLLLLSGCAAPPEPVDGAIPGLIEDLGDEDPEVRALAMAELRRLGPRAEGALRENLGRPDAEIAARCAELLRKPPSLDARARVITRVQYVDPVLAFVVIGAGRAEGVVGLRFEILHGTRWVASAEFEKFLGNGANISKLRIVAGRAVDIELDDLAIGF
jgi:hypothetical protein